jgi:hypothetical protein
MRQNNKVIVYVQNKSYIGISFIISRFLEFMFQNYIRIQNNEIVQGNVYLVTGGNKEGETN